MSRILVIEDDAAFGRVLARSLRRAGHSVDLAADVDSALHAASLAAPNAAILDLRLGEDNGLNLIEPLLARLPGLRILVLTGYASIATAVEAIRRGAWDYLAKPADTQAILTALADKRSSPASPPNTPLSPQRLEWEHIQRVLRANDGNVSATARALGMHRRTLQRKLSKRPTRE